MKHKIGLAPCLLAAVLFCITLVDGAAAARQITDASGRTILVPDTIERVICSGSGCLRLLTYFQVQDRVVGVDDIETRKNKFDARPYSLAYPGYRKLPVFGGFRGRDDPEKILGLTPLPQVIFKTYPAMGMDPVALQAKTGIPVVVLEYGDLWKGRDHFFTTLKRIGQVLDKPHRAEALIRFFKNEIADLDARTRDISDRKRCFVGGIAFKGPHGFQSTEPAYPPFQFVHANNIAAESRSSPHYLRHSHFSKEKILQADPDILFLDLSTLQMGKGSGGLHELKTDPVYRALTAVQTGQVYGVLPYNWYTQNCGSILSNAWYIGKVLYPARFQDIDPVEKADQIYRFLVSQPVYGEMNRRFNHMAFKPIPLDR